MLAILLGVVLAILLARTTGLGWALIPCAWVPALVLQHAYAVRLNSWLGGKDPVATYGARNLRQLRSLMHVPFAIVGLQFCARALWCAGAAAVLIALGWL